MNVKVEIIKSNLFLTYVAFLITKNNILNIFLIAKNTKNSIKIVLIHRTTMINLRSTKAKCI